MGLAVILAWWSTIVAATNPDDARPPNVLLIIADDLGSGDLGCYGQEKIRTPNLDRLAREGLRSTAAYSAAPVCAPSRCALLTGRDMGHASIRDNRAGPPNCEVPLPDGEFTLAESLRERGYRTACIGKWGLGPVGSEGAPRNQGFDRFFGYYCQVHAHDHYTDYLYDDEKKIDNSKDSYVPDRFLGEALRFLESDSSKPFFLLYATTIPHLALQVPEDSLDEYRGRLDDEPYDGKHGYRPHEYPHAAYAAMVTRLDRDVGALLLALSETGVADDTLVIFTSDNGATFDTGGSDTAYFRSNGVLRGVKTQLYEGGIRVPFLVRWPNRIEAGRVDPTPISHVDLFATLASTCGSRPPAETEGLDLTELFTSGTHLPDRPLYFEHASGGGWRAVRVGNWKLVVRGERKGSSDVTRELFDLATDPGEATNRIDDEPSALARLVPFLANRSEARFADWEFR